ncbi:MAG: aminotransferase class I/II-fold pyridoxal phosphate-dependent enzyme [Deltaproteobacteria bacterium]|nr:aminotransferase class I/II-fold pyridoxal phosphate-dependent enzyme [Deltaproteobacteria bacterium]
MTPLQKMGTNKTKKSYPWFLPSFTLPQGKTAKLFEQLIALKTKGKNEGGDELLALISWFLGDPSLRQMNYFITPESDVIKLIHEWLLFLTSSKAPPKQMTLAAAPVANATVGLLATLMAYDVAGGEVITTSLNYPAMPNVILMAGATPHFVDVNKDDFCMNMDSLAKAINEKTKAIILVHLNQFVDLEPLDRLLRKLKRDIPVIQDASVAFGSKRSNIPLGIFNIGTNGTTIFSFATTKTITSLGGGMIMANSQELINHIAAIAFHGLDLSKAMDVSTVGSNFRINDLNVPLLREQLKKADRLFSLRRKLQEVYRKALQPLVDDGLMQLQTLHEEAVVGHYAVLVPKRDQVGKTLFGKEGIQLGCWPAHHHLPFYQQRCPTPFGGTLSTTDAIADQFAFLPFSTDLTPQDVRFICKALYNALRQLT